MAEKVSSADISIKARNEHNTLTAEEFSRARYEAGILGVEVAKAIALNGDQSAARVGAARLLMEFAGFMGLDKGRRGLLGKEPANMSLEELKALVSTVDNELASRAKPVNEPNTLSIEQELFDMSS